MKSKELEVKSAKLSKTARAALPLFALFGGQGFATSRNPLSLQSSKKLAGKAVVYINETEVPELPKIGIHKTQQRKSLFAAFTNQTISATHNASVAIQSKTLDFLKSNDLLSSNMTQASNISGSISSRKTFSDDWQWSTRLNVFPPLPFLPSTVYSTCVTGASWAGNPLAGIYWKVESSIYSCVTNNLVSYVSTNAAAILATCQALHMACDQQALPVELLKFEID